MNLHVILITGSRDWEDVEPIKANILQEQKRAEEHGRTLLVVHGGAKGADQLAEQICEAYGIHTSKVVARWEEYRRSAGRLRNTVMAEMFEYDAVLAYPLPQSKGTKHMMKIARTK